MKSKKTTINPKNNDDKCFQYGVTVVLNYQNIKYNPERTSNINPFIGHCNWNEINFQSIKKDWNEFENNNETKAFNFLYVLYNTKEIRHAYKSKHNSK